MSLRAWLLFIFCIARLSAAAQAIRGEVIDMADKHQVADVSIENIYTSLAINTDDHGAFLIAANSGQLLEFRKPGYKTTRVRIPQGYVPSFFRIIMEKGISHLKDIDINQGNRYDYASDSTRFHDLYAHELDFAKLSTIDAISHPFSALSGKNREIWRFQDDYKVFEQEKYVDRTFNEKLITQFTGLTGDSLHYYMRRYRPTYQQLKSMNDYAFYNFIKQSVYNYRSSADRSRGAQ